MNVETFWRLVEPGKDGREAEERLRERLADLEPRELVAFQRVFDELFARAYRIPLWGAAYLMGGGCSDDGFTDFRYALIAAGRKIYEQALADPDSLVEVEIERNELFGYVAAKLFKEKTGENMPFDEESRRSMPPHGQDWDFDDVEESRRRLPRLAARYLST